MVHRKSNTTARVIKISLEIPQMITKVLSDVCLVAGVNCSEPEKEVDRGYMTVFRHSRYRKRHSKTRILEIPLHGKPCHIYVLWR